MQSHCSTVTVHSAAPAQPGTYLRIRTAAASMAAKRAMCWRTPAHQQQRHSGHEKQINLLTSFCWWGAGH